VIDRSTHDALGGRIATEALGTATFKGIAAAVEVFAVS
jgi:class 3 adenylate cyclase